LPGSYLLPTRAGACWQLEIGIARAPGRFYTGCSWPLARALRLPVAGHRAKPPSPSSSARSALAPWALVLRSLAKFAQVARAANNFLD
jgi:hypothetical protein